MVFVDDVTSDPTWIDFSLERGESKTILARYVNGMPTKADIVIAIDYRYFGTHGRRFFRFEGNHIDNWHWDKQPTENIYDDLNKITDDAIRRMRAN